MGWETLAGFGTQLLGQVISGSAKSPKVDAVAARSEISTASTNTKKARSALLETAGGTAGAELMPGQVANSRDTILGN